MHAAVVNVLGQPPRYQSFTDPEPKDGEALIQVRAAGLHPVVKARASGAHYSSDGVVPAIPGVDGVGEPGLLWILSHSVWIDGGTDCDAPVHVHSFTRWD